jgi:DNA-binding FadR family transcriptional regulator
VTTEKPDSEGEEAGGGAAALRLLDKPDRIKLDRIKVPKSSDMLAEKLQEQILSGAYPPGSSLPTERELVFETGLSRGSIREGLRILETQGLVNTRAGRYGGAVVSQPSDALLANHISVFARGRSISLRSLVEVRQALAPMIAYLAAQNRTEQDLAELKRISAVLEAAAPADLNTFLEENANWHTALASASHNELLFALAASIFPLMVEASRIENFASKEVRGRAVIAHQRILQAIEDRDAETARRRAERDVQAYATYLEAALASAKARDGADVTDAAE